MGQSRLKKLCLGTASWGWSVNETVAYSIADCFYATGGRYIDTANNYPINGCKADYRRSPLILANWCKRQKVTDLKVFFKVGSVSNKYTPSHDLSPEYLQSQIEWAEENFGPNLYCIMIHWDNRAQLAPIEESCKILEVLEERKIEFGISGIKYPELYRTALANANVNGLHIQSKHNFVDSDLDRFEELAFLKPIYWAYSISVGGLKLAPDEYEEKGHATLTKKIDYHKNLLSGAMRNSLLETIECNDEIDSVYHIAIANCERQGRLNGYLVAPGSTTQMEDIVDFRRSTDFGQLDLSRIEKLQPEFKRILT